MYMDNIANGTRLILLMLLIIVIVAGIIFVPFWQIYAVNQLFKTEIEYSWFNWGLVLFLGASIRSICYRGIKDER